MVLGQMLIDLDRERRHFLEGMAAAAKIAEDLDELVIEEDGTCGSPSAYSASLAILREIERLKADPNWPSS